MNEENSSSTRDLGATDPEFTKEGEAAQAAAAENRPSGDIDETLALPSDGPVSTRPVASGSRYDVLRDHAKGGLGKVSVARDNELNREVALKEIQERHARDPASRSRFVLEAEITGALEHPGIVPVYGLGQYDDGRPYYAMRFIRGDSLSINHLGVAHAQAGHFEKAFPLLRHALSRREETLGADHDDTLQSIASLAFALAQVGDYGAAAPLFKKRLEWAERKLGKDHPSTLGSLQNLAIAYQGQGDHVSALPLHREANERRREALGEDHIDTLFAMNSLAQAYTRVGEYDEAIPMLEECLSRRKKTLGADHPHVLVTMLDSALAFQADDDMPQAISMFEQAVESHRAKFGAEHGWTIGAANQLTAAYLRGGQVDKAISAVEKTWEHSQAGLLESDEKRKTAMNYLAMAYKTGKKYDKALPMFAEMLKNAREKLGDAHPNTLACVWNLAVTQLAADQAETALPLLKEFIDGRRALAPADPSRFACELLSAANTLNANGQFQDAETYLRECLAFQKSNDLDDGPFFVAQSLLGETLAEQTKYEDAEAQLLAAHSGQADSAGDDDTQLVETLTRLVALYTVMKNPAEQERWRAKLDELRPPMEPSRIKLSKRSPQTSN